MEKKEVISGHNFDGAEVSLPFSDRLFDNTSWLDCYPFINGNLWQSFNDRFYLAFDEPKWTHLEVKKEDVARLWPFTPAPDSSSSMPASIAKSTDAKSPRIIPGRDADVRNRIETVLRTAERVFERNPSSGLSQNQAVKMLLEQPEVRGMSFTFVREILRGTYEPMEKRGITSPYAGVFKRR
jgi:hypothetical protein